MKRFWDKVKKSNKPDSCWEWTGCRDNHGYGEFSFKGRQVRAHRVAWMLTNDTDIPKGMCVFHSCCMRACVNPGHLFLAKKGQARTLEERFWAKVKKIKNGCWEWQASCDKKGYGQFSVNRVMVRAHRIAWELANGLIPKGICVLHHCDNRLCVNPDHLFLGTFKDNSIDMVKKKRHARNCVKLKQNEVVEIRKQYAKGFITQYELATIYKITQGQISQIVRKKHWK